MTLAEHIAAAIDQWHASHPDVTIGEIGAAFDKISDAIAEAGMSHDRNKSFGENVIPFVQ